MLLLHSRTCQFLHNGMNKISKYKILGYIGKVLIFIPLTLIFTIVSVTSFSPVAITSKKGDINGDGIISSLDVTSILSYTQGKTSDFSELDFYKADLNSDGFITAKDAYLANNLVSASVVIKYEEETEPLVENSFISTSAIPIISENGAYNVISDQKMYIYPDLSQVMQMRDTFIIISFGWGHGVGMSQWGAVGLARAGYSYIQIIQHYYRGVMIMKEQYPATVRCAGRDVDTVEMLARIVQQEISGITKRNDPVDRNALRAQAVAAYTNMKYSDYSVSGCSYVNSYSSCREDVKSVAREIAGQYMLYNNKVPYAYYSACSAGVAATYRDIWGSTNRDMSYLTKSASYYDCYTDGYIKATAYTPEALKNYILSYDPSIVLPQDPANWIRILSHDDAVNENIGYVSAMQIGNRTFSEAAGITFRDKLMRYNVNSPCFAIIYNGQYL